MKQTSIVIVSMNRLDNLYPCLESIRTYCSLAECEIFVVAYLFSKENLLRLKEDFPEVQIIESNEVRGFSENNNLALHQVTTPYCFVLNDDTVMTSDVISGLLSDFENLPSDAAIITPKLLNADGSLQLCGRPEYPSYKYFLRQWHLCPEPTDDSIGKKPIFGKVFKTSNISGAAFLIKTQVFKELGFFDESYFFTPEDLALSTKARQCGYSVYVDKDAEIIHKWRTTASEISAAIRPASIRGSLIFWSKGSNLRYILLGLGVYLAELSKLIKSSILYFFAPSDKRRLSCRTYRANCRAVFTHKSPKQLFVKNTIGD